MSNVTAQSYDVNFPKLIQEDRRTLVFRIPGCDYDIKAEKGVYGIHPGMAPFLREYFDIDRYPKIPNIQEDFEIRAYSTEEILEAIPRYRDIAVKVKWEQYGLRGNDALRARGYSTTDIGLETESLFEWMKETQKTWKKAHKAQVINVDLYKIQEPDKVINKRYLDPQDLQTDKRVIAGKSQKNTGKTTAFKRLPELKDRVIALGHRNALGRNLTEDLDLKHHEDGIEALKSDRLFITLDSLPKLDLWRFKGATVLIDEFGQVLRHLLGDTIGKAGTTHKVYRVLEWLLMNAGKVIVTDADMSQVDIDWLSSVVGRENIHVVVNEAKVEPKDFIREISTNALMLGLECSLKQGKNVFVGCDTQKRAQVIKEMFGGQYKTLEIDSDNSSTDPEALSFLKNPTKVSQQYQLVVGSPSLTTGINIDNTHFDATYLFIDSGKTLPPTDLLQVLL